MSKTAASDVAADRDLIPGLCLSNRAVAMPQSPAISDEASPRKPLRTISRQRPSVEEASPSTTERSSGRSNSYDRVAAKGLTS
jgi:hypothetical protein